MVKISGVIITLNEEKHIERCIRSLQPVVDEIVVVDSFSTDQTKAICLSLEKVRFIENPFKGHIEQKNYAIDQAQNQIVLSLDADEMLSEKLQQNILAVKNNWQKSGYSFNRLTNYVGHWVHHCGWYPDVKLRLFDKNKARWGGDNPHDIVIMPKEYPVEHLSGDLLHYSYSSISAHVEQTNRFTTIAAKSAFNKGVRSSHTKIVTRPLLKFFRDYFYKRGFMDGRYGLTICLINALSAFLKYAKIYELQKGKPLS